MSPGHQDAMAAGPLWGVDTPPPATHFYTTQHHPTPPQNTPCVRMCARAGAISVKYGLIYLL